MIEVAADDYPILQLGSQIDWQKWLDKNCSSSNGVWLKFAKKNSGETTLNYKEALEEALCYGWIDSQAKTYDEKFYLQKFTPRRSKSIWSRINVEKIEALMAAGKLKPSGLAQVEAAKADGRWTAAYASPSATQMQDYFLKALEKNKKAKDFFETISKGNKYAIAWRLHQAKRPETKERLTNKYIDMLAEGKTIH
ncbi:MAG: bacteriocin-protection protein YdeI/OmpD-associated family [Candidatus Saccharibacteria bacterium]|nr:bacteriocin-protection protein YdeI/OmpD-associated family [Candidatus Saccharibacteria bacterium]